MRRCGSGADSRPLRKARPGYRGSASTCPHTGRAKTAHTHKVRRSKAGGRAVDFLSQPQTYVPCFGNLEVVMLPGFPLLPLLQEIQEPQLRRGRAMGQVLLAVQRGPGVPLETPATLQGLN